jgi:hypothetical protein
MKFSSGGLESKKGGYRMSVAASTATVGSVSEAESCGQVFAEQPARTYVPPQRAPHLVTCGLGDRAHPYAVHGNLRHDPGPHTMSSKVVDIDTGPFCHVLEDRSY